MVDLRYPIGKFAAPVSITEADLASAIAAIAALPAELREATENLDERQLDTPYRPEGWTVRQVVHHVADSHMNAFIRMRKGLTEVEPSISDYNEAAWAELADSLTEEPDVSLTLLDCLHRRWTATLRSLKEPDWQRSFVHPARGKVRLDSNTLLYAWHGRHHVAHIQNLRQRERW